MANHLRLYAPAKYTTPVARLIRQHLVATLLLSLFAPWMATASQVEAPDVAATAIASLTDPAKLATLTGDRAANSRLKKAVYWLVEARSRGRTTAHVGFSA
jgi:hypothetical protein